MRRGGLAALVLVVQLCLSACATPVRLPAVPTGQTAQAQPVVPNTRFWPDRESEPFLRAAEASVAKERAWLARSGQANAPAPPVTFLAISGGGDAGAFAAGLLVGWTERGDRPVFRAVTGISTGALIAPFAFLGPLYDHVLREAYTEVSRDDILRRRFITAALWDDAMADSQPLAQLIKRFITPEVLAEIAVEADKGRLLFIGTTDLDSREPVIWDMTAIAASRSPAALDLFRKVVLASASIPGAFPPVMFDVTVNGQRHQEMHVDGGTSHQVFMYPSSFELRAVALQDRPRTIYVIRNSRLDPDWASVDRRTLSIAGRSVSSLIHTQGLGDLTQIFLLAQRDGVKFNLAFIPADFSVPREHDFDTNYMRQLFDRGRQMGLSGSAWRNIPPEYPTLR